MKRNSESGQAIILVVLALGLFLVGALGLAIDGGHLFAQRQMAQAAADAAAQAAALSILDMTNTTENNNNFTGGPFTCLEGSTFTPCKYASANGFRAPSDQIQVSFPGSVPGVALSPDFSPNAVQVIVTRPVNTTFMRLLGSSSADISALAVAALVQVESPVPIIITHPTLAPSLTLGGTTYIKICGGPKRSIQVNSDGTFSAKTAVKLDPPQNAVGPTGSSGVGNTAFDLSKGGPLDTNRDCTTPGTGTDMGVWGPPSKANSVLSIVNGPVTLCAKGSLCVGTAGSYLEPASPIYDPLEHVAPPPNPGTYRAPLEPNTSMGTHTGELDCPVTATKGCKIFYPGEYANGIQVKDVTAIFNPGIYYIDGAPTSGEFKGVGFGTGANADVVMCSVNCETLPACCDTDKGMLVYLTKNGGVINLTANSSSRLMGTDFDSDYLGTLFFVARDAPLQTHTIGGGGELALVGTIYATNCTPGRTCLGGINMTPTLYQKILLQGGSGSGTVLRGEIITSVLDMGGNGAITMQLSPDLLFPITQVALVK